MPRARNIKPAFFRNEFLAQLPPITRLLYIGLWTEADRAGRLEDRPARIKIALFPLDAVDVDVELDRLVAAGFIVRYQVGADRYIEIPTFAKHQNPHHREPESGYPSSSDPAAKIASPRRALGEPGASLGRALLIPDPGSLNPDYPAPDDAGAESVPDPAGALEPENDAAPVQATMPGFSLAPVRRTKAPPVREIAEMYLANLPMLPKVDPARIRTELAKSIGARWREAPERQSLEWWAEYFRRVAASPFLTGGRTDFRATLAWLAGPKNMGKVLDGQYDPAPGQPSQLIAARARREWSAVVSMLPNPREAKTDNPVTAAVVAELGGFQRLARLPRFDLGHEMGRFVDEYIRRASAMPVGGAQ